MPARFAALLVLLLAGAAPTACGGDDSQDQARSSPTQAATSVATAPAEEATADASQTPAPVSPSVTPAVSAVPVASDWKRFSAEGLEMWLPGSYAGGSPASADFDLILEGLRSLGREDLVALVEAGRESFVLFMLDNDPASVGANANVIFETVPESFSLEAIVDQSIAFFPSGVSVLERGNLSIGSQGAVRVLIELDLGEFMSRSLQYYFKAGTGFWVVTYSHVFPDFEAVLETFERSAGTIKVGQ